MPEVYQMEQRLRSDYAFAAATVRGLVMKLDGNHELVPAGAADGDAVGYSAADFGTPHAKGPIIVINASGTAMLRSAGAFAKRAVLYQAAGGKVDDAGTIRRGIALDEATGADQLVEVLLQDHGVGA